MSKFCLAFLTVVSAMALQSSVVTAETLFKGTIKFARKSNCDGSIVVGDVQHARYHPHTAILPTNGHFSALNRIALFQGTTWSLYPSSGGIGGNFTSTFAAVEGWTVSDVLHIPASSRQLRVTSLKPATLTATSPIVTVTGQIMNPFGVVGQESCIVDFVAALVNEIN